MPDSSDLQVIDLGVVDYAEAWKIQKDFVEKRVLGQVPDTLLLCEHPAVITLGRGAQRGEAAAQALIQPFEGTQVLEIERGGLATYHGPGQLVVYPIVQLARKNVSPAKSGVVNLIRAMEEAMISFLSQQGLQAQAIEGKTGVWITNAAPQPNRPPERKIASIGIAVRRWVSYHGLALNYATGLEPWKQMNPCGFSADVMTDLSLETDRLWTREELIGQFVPELEHLLSPK